jgi:chemotaxis protein CheX
MKKLHEYVDMILSNKKVKKEKKKAQPASLNVDFLNPFIDATLEVLKVTANVESEKDFAFIKEDHVALGDITGLLPITSEKYAGSFSITFSSEVYLNVMSKMLEEEFSEINDENKDGIGELCN